MFQFVVHTFTHCISVTTQAELGTIEVLLHFDWRLKFKNYVVIVQVEVTWFHGTFCCSIHVDSSDFTRCKCICCFASLFLHDCCLFRSLVDGFLITGLRLCDLMMKADVSGQISRSIKFELASCSGWWITFCVGRLVG